MRALSGREPIQGQLEKIVSSRVLRGSESLCRLLRYLTEQSHEGQRSPIKEYQIAIEVLGRPADFDPRLDATVRVQTGRLRSKLAEYYAGEGAGDRLVFEIPKGTYSLAVRMREPAVAALPGAPPRPPSPRARKWLPWCVSAGLAAALAYAILIRPGSAHPSLPPALHSLWSAFLGGPERPLVVFSNAEFVGRPETGMRYFDASRDTRSTILDYYTGVGEVLAIHELGRTFNLLRSEVRVKRGRLLSLDDAKSNDLIFVGSPSENLALREIRPIQEFAFEVAASGPRQGDLEIVNIRPQRGEPRSYIGSDAVPIAEDYALVASVPGMTPGRSAMVLAGTTTIGTQAAVEYVCREEGARELVSKAGRDGHGAILPFEAVLHVRISGGVPVRSEVVALHPRR